MVSQHGTKPMPPTGMEYPYGTTKGVTIAPFHMPAAGQGLYDIHPLTDSPHLFAEKG